MPAPRWVCCPTPPRSALDPDWRVAEAPPDLLDRRVEITGPAEPKMIINALNSGARAFMADFEDSLAPTWENVVGGQAALRDAVRGTLAFDSPEGKAYRLGDRPATAARPAARLASPGAPRQGGRRADLRRRCSTSGCTRSTTRGSGCARGSGLYLYLPKLQSHREARLWNDVFVQAQAALGSREARCGPRS